MDAEVKERLDTLEAGIDAFMVQTDQHLYNIAQGLSKLSEMVELYAGFSNAVANELDAHKRDH